MTVRKFWNWKNSADGGERVLTFDGPIADESWYGDEITPKAFKDELESGKGPVTVWLNSPGGDCFAASQIYSMLTEYSDTVTVKIDGLAASAASVVAMAGDVVMMAPTAMMMIHNPSMCAWGDHADMQKAIDVLNEAKESILNAYELKTGLSRTKLSHMMDDETWMNARKALELGFIDRLTTDKETGNAYAYASASTIKAITNKLAKKTQNTGAKVSDLRARLYESLLTF